MKGKNLIIMGLLALAAGVILIFTYRGIRSTGVVITGGVLFILSGIFNVLAAGYERRRAERAGGRGRGMLSATFNWLACAGAVILGVCMLIFQGTFVALIPFIFGILIAFTAFYQLYLLAYGTRPAMLPGWLYIVPVALAGAAVYLFLQKPELDDSIIMLTTGISLGVFGLATFAEGAMLGNIRRRNLKQEKEAEKNTMTDTVKEASADSPTEKKAESAATHTEPLDVDPDHRTAK